MFAREQRLSRDRIAEIMKNGRKYSGRFFYVRMLPSPQFGAGFSIGKKIATLSVTRHLLKRRAAHALRGAVAESGVTAHLFLIARPELRAASAAELQADFKGILRQIAAKDV